VGPAIHRADCSVYKAPQPDAPGKTGTRTTLETMADWTDGAEYAPVERPAGFATPRATPLELVEEPASPADGQPAVPPSEYRAEAARPLEELVPLPRSPRDPATPFGLNGTVAESSWGAVHSSTSWHPTQPLSTGNTATSAVVAGPTLPAPTGAPVWPAPMANPHNTLNPQNTLSPQNTQGPQNPLSPPNAQGPWAAQHQQYPAQQQFPGQQQYPGQQHYPGQQGYHPAEPKGTLWEAFTPGTMLTIGLLVAGLLFADWAPYLLIGASLASGSITRGREIIRPAFSASMFALIASWLAQDIGAFDLGAAGAGQLLCLIMLVVVPASVWWSWRR